LKIHFVKAGETLYEIGKKYGVTVEEIVAANKTIIDPNLIMEGMKLIIPVKQMQAPMQGSMQPSMQTPAPTPYPAPIPADIIAPSIPHYPVQQNMATNQTMPQAQTMPTNQTMPLAQTMPTNQTMPQAQTMPINQTMPLAQSLPANMPTQQAYPNLPSSQQPVYPGLALPPFAEIPVPAQQVIAPASMPNTSAWSLPPEYTAYNTPFHMNNYSMPYPNQPQQVMAQPMSYYEPYSANAMPYPSNENYEYYNTYSSLNNHAAWPSHNAQPHAQVLGTQNNMKEANAMMEHEANESISPLKENEKARTSAASIATKANQPGKSKKNTLHDQVVRLHQSRNRR
jgi:LysM repeat protein